MDDYSVYPKDLRVIWWTITVFCWLDKWGIFRQCQ